MRRIAKGLFFSAMLLVSCLAMFTACEGVFGNDCTHSGGTPTCTTKAVCAKCGEGYGETAAHSFKAGACEECGAADPGYVPSVKSTLTFVSNGGSSIEAYVKGVGETISAPAAPSRDGYEFKGWFLDNGTFSNEYAFSVMPESNLSVYAKWEYINYTLAYELNGGQLKTANKTAYTIADLPFTLNEPTKTGEIFEGWYTENNTGGTKITTLTESNKGNYTLYALWSADPLAGCSILSAPEFDIEGALLTKTEPLRNSVASYDFFGKLTISDGASYYISRNYELTDTITGSTVTLTAGTNTFYICVTAGDNQSRNIYTVKIYKNRLTTITYYTDETGGTVHTTQTGQEENQLITAPLTTPTKPSYSFEGWYKDTALTQKWDFETDTAVYELKLYASYEFIYSGSGTPESPYIIDTALKLSDLAALVNGGNSFDGVYFVLGKSLDLEDAEWTPIGLSGDYAFAGTFDGKDFTVSNFQITASGQNAGLFGYNKGVIKNFKVTGFSFNVTFLGTAYIGGLAGYNAGTVTGCSANGVISAAASDTSSTVYAGGLIGFSGKSVTNCSAEGELTIIATDVYAGGLIGRADKIADCSADVSVTATSATNITWSYSMYAGGLTAYNDGEISESRAEGDVILKSTTTNTNYTVNIYAGGLTGYASGALTGCYATGAVTANAATANSSSTAYSGGLAGRTSVAVRQCYATGKIIATGRNMYAGGLAGSSSGMIIASYATGEVSATNSATTASFYAHAGGLTGYNYKLIINCYATGTASADASTNNGVAYAYAGGLSGYNADNIINSYAAGNASAYTRSGYNPIDTTSYAGGLVGRNDNAAAITNSYAAGNISATVSNGSTFIYLGGLAGNSAVITNCYRSSAQTVTKVIGTATTSVPTNDLGSAAGLADLKSEEWLKANLWSDAWQAWSYGGNEYPVINYGYFNQDAIEINNADDLTALQDKILLLNYKLTSNINLSAVSSWKPVAYNLGVFDGNGFVISGLKISSAVVRGGLFAYNYGTIQNLGANVTISFSVSTAGTYYAGGLTGVNSGRITNCYVKGSVSISSTKEITAYAGGIAGSGSGISCCYSTASISVSLTGTVTTGYVGGIVGDGADITSCFSTGNLSVSGSRAYLGSISSTSRSTQCYKYVNQSYYRYSNNTTYTVPSNGYEPNTCTAENLNSADFYVSNLLWDSAIWDFSDLDFLSGKTPVFKAFA